MKESIKDVLEKHYYGRNRIEEECSSELLTLFRTLLMSYEDYTSYKVLGKKTPRVSKNMVDDFLNNN